MTMTTTTPGIISVIPPTTRLSFTPRLIPRPHAHPLRCEVAVRSASVSDSEDEEVKSKLEKVGSKVRVKSPMKVYHVPRVPEVELTSDMEGTIKQYVGFWKGKRITANYPFKVEFFVDIEGRGKVKFLAHLKDDEFDFIE